MSKTKKQAAEEKAELEKLSPGERARREIYDWIQSLMAALIFCVLLFSFGIRLIDVNGPSMNPTLYEGNKMLVSGLFYKPKPGDIVVFRNVDKYGEEKALVKRVIAVEGQEINIDFDKGLIYVRDADGEEQYVLDEPYLVAEYDENGVRKEHPISKQDFIGPQTVPEGCVFVMGDNRNSSHDSRSNDIGMVDARLIIGRVYAVVYPISEMRWVR
jgi:signal peptidase I